MKPKTLLPLIALYGVAFAATWYLRYSLNALTVLGSILAVIAATVLISRATVTRQSRSGLIVGAILFALYSGLLSALVLTGEPLAAITANSAGLSSGHVVVALDQPVQNTLVSTAIYVLAHWRLGVGGRARERATAQARP